MTGGSYLERIFLPALPGFAAEWARLARARPPGAEPDAGEFLDGVARELQALAAAGHVAEAGRVLRVIERLLEEADPILADLLVERVLRPLADAVGQGTLAPSSVLPFLGPRGRSALERGISD